MVLSGGDATGVIALQYLILFNPQKILAALCKRMSVPDVNQPSVHLTYSQGEPIEDSIHKPATRAFHGQHHRCIDGIGYPHFCYRVLTQALC